MIAKRALREIIAARTWREVLYALLGWPLGMLGFAAVAATLLLTVASIGTVVVLVPILPLFLALDRVVAGLCRRTANRLLGLDVPKPTRQPRGPGLLGFLGRYVADPVSWRSVAYLALRLPLGLVQFGFGVLPWLYALTFMGYPLIWKLTPGHVTDRYGVRHSSALQLGSFYFDTWPRAMLAAAFGALVLCACPWITRASLLIDRWLLPRLLGPSASSVRIRELEETRANAINEAAATLRRIERDLHDGVQARLVALGMQLGRAESRLKAQEYDRVSELVRTSRQDAKEIIGELRELVRGIHPPALDSGLEPALRTLAARSPIPASVRVELPQRPPASVETMLYFSAAELLTNAGKHSGASTIALTLLSDGERTRLIATDDGKGGARLDGAGTGLRGLAERVRTVDGHLDVDSPPGGPTTITIELPIRL
ncbi:MAG TPA: sensor domain-containing protein [Actinocrinis sp.]|uniref:sensor histidine kinase n=1 Tax=Actinocrinis sp. TaxID=1920516 RepID=UPI002D50A36A|nr:sensor domain-containing protein [Actinocrinis sp.]HZU57274.1 sensor domain-containing protein [Actinocrinis sp.]